MSRAVREGSVGLMILGGLALLFGTSMWLKGTLPGADSSRYTILAHFDEAAGIQEGGTVRYRGIRVGKIAKIRTDVPGVGVEVALDITEPTVKIPRSAIAEVSQTGLIGEPVIELTTPDKLANAATLAKANESNCDKNQIVCDQAVIKGQAGASFNELLRRTTALVNRYESPEIYNGLKKTLDNASLAAAEIASLSKRFGDLPDTLKKELAAISTSANNLTQSLDGTVKNANGVVTKVGAATDKIAATTDRFGVTADRISKTADNASTTAADLSKLAKSVDALVTENRQTFSSTLGNFNALSVDLRRTVNSLEPTIAKLNDTTTRLNSEKLVKDLEGTLANANKAAANLQTLTASLNDSKTLSNLRETLDSARATFQNAQKITADLDELTGDPVFINNIKKLVNGLGNLVDAGDTIERQIRLARELEPVNIKLNQSVTELARSGALAPSEVERLQVKTQTSGAPAAVKGFGDRGGDR
jgi:phospholipid/cholesterol/gamma-HCH transport system substrate-binding protein